MLYNSQQPNLLTLPGARKGGSIIRDMTTLRLTDQPTVITSKHALISDGVNQIADLRNGTLSFVATATLKSITVDPILETLVSGHPIQTPSHKVCRFFAEENGEPIRKVILANEDFSDSASLKPSTTRQTIQLNGGAIRIRAGFAVIWGQKAGQADVLLSNLLGPFGSPLSYELITTYPGEYDSIGVEGALGEATVDVTYWVTGMNTTEYIRLDNVVIDSPGPAGDLFSTPRDYVTLMDGFLVGDGRRVSEVPITQDDMWKAIEPQFHDLRPGFSMFSIMTDEDATDQLSRFELSLGRQVTTTVGAISVTRIVPVAKMIVFSNGGRSCCGESPKRYILGIDRLTGYTHGRMRRIYPPYLGNNDMPNSTLHIFHTEFDLLSLRAAGTGDSVTTTPITRQIP